MKALNTIVLITILVTSCGPAMSKLATEIHEDKAADANIVATLDSNGPTPKKAAPVKASKAADTNDTVADTNSDSNAVAANDANLAVDANVTVQVKTATNPLTGTWVSACSDGVIEKRMFQSGMETILTYVFGNTSCEGAPEIFTQTFPIWASGESVRSDNGYQGYEVNGDELTMGQQVQNETDVTVGVQVQVFTKE